MTESLECKNILKRKTMHNFRFEKYVTEAARKIKLLYTAVYRTGFETRCLDLKIPSPEDNQLI